MSSDEESLDRSPLMGGCAYRQGLSQSTQCKCMPCERWLGFFCVQLPCLIFGGTYACVGVYCFVTGALVYGSDARSQDKALAAENKFRILMMAAAGFVITFSLACTTVFSKACDDVKVMEFINSTWKEEKWEGKAEGEPPGPEFFLRKLEELDPKYETVSLLPSMARQCCIEYLMRPLITRSWKVKWCSLLPCYILGLFQCLHPVWWWKRIVDFSDLDFSEGGGLGDSTYAMWMGASSSLLTGIFFIAAIWQHVRYMLDDIYVSQFAALQVIQSIGEAYEQLDAPEKLAPEVARPNSSPPRSGIMCLLSQRDWNAQSGLSRHLEVYIDWNVQLGIVMRMKKDLELFWSSPAVYTPWFSLGLVGVVLVVLGGITGLNTGFVSMSAVGQMARNYMLVGCFIILIVLYALSSIAALFCRPSTQTPSVSAWAERFLRLYLQKIEKDIASPHGAGAEAEAARRAEEQRREEYVQSARRFIEYVTKDQVGARVVGGVLITREFATLVLKAMVSGISILIIVNKGVLSYMKETLDTAQGEQEGAEAICTVSAWVSRKWTQEEKSRCCLVDMTFCEEPPEDRKWLQDILGDIDQVRGPFSDQGDQIPEHLRSKIHDLLRAAAIARQRLREPRVAKVGEGGEKAADG